ncbi:Anaphase-promoting complex subunit 10 [Galdieria sulphuraria]|nr:Anaphase-promoting complex subunit 10 [Galdieria sulphuraria]
MAQGVKDWLKEDPEFADWVAPFQEDNIYLPIDSGLDDLSKEAIWSVSSAKIGNGVEKLRDGRVDTFWQSDSTLPHVINIQFNSRKRVSEVRLFLDYRYDESYTPQKIAIRAGNYFRDLEDILQKELSEPQGWVRIPLCEEDLSQDSSSKLVSFFRVALLQIVILANHQSGKDTHVRQVQVVGFRNREKEKLFNQPNFQTIDFLAYQYLR